MKHSNEAQKHVQQTRITPPYSPNQTHSKVQGDKKHVGFSTCRNDTQLIELFSKMALQNVSSVTTHCTHFRGKKRKFKRIWDGTKQANIQNQSLSSKQLQLERSSIEDKSDSRLQKQAHCYKSQVTVTIDPSHPHAGSTKARCEARPLKMDLQEFLSPKRPSKRRNLKEKQVIYLIKWPASKKIVKIKTHLNTSTAQVYEKVRDAFNIPQGKQISLFRQNRAFCQSHEMALLNFDPNIDLNVPLLLQLQSTALSGGMQDFKEKTTSHDFHPPQFSNLDSEPEDEKVVPEINPSGKIADNKSDSKDELAREILSSPDQTQINEQTQTAKKVKSAKKQKNQNKIVPTLICEESFVKDEPTSNSQKQLLVVANNDEQDAEIQNPDPSAEAEPEALKILDLLKPSSTTNKRISLNLIASVKLSAFQEQEPKEEQKKECEKEYNDMCPLEKQISQQESEFERLNSLHLLPSSSDENNQINYLRQETLKRDIRSKIFEKELGVEKMKTFEKWQQKSIKAQVTPRNKNFHAVLEDEKKKYKKIDLSSLPTEAHKIFSAITEEGQNLEKIQDQVKVNFDRIALDELNQDDVIAQPDGEISLDKNESGSKNKTSKKLSDQTRNKLNTNLTKQAKQTGSKAETAWRIESYHPMICMVDMNRRDILYLSSQTDNWGQILAVDLSKLGLFYAFLKELSQELREEDVDQNPISIAIEGFRESKKDDDRSQLNQTNSDKKDNEHHELTLLKLYCKDNNQLAMVDQNGERYVLSGTLLRYKNKPSSEHAPATRSLRGAFNFDQAGILMVQGNEIFAPLSTSRLKFDFEGQHDVIDSFIQIKHTILFSTYDTKSESCALQVLKSQSKKQLFKRFHLTPKKCKIKCLGGKQESIERIVQMQQCPHNERLQAFEPKIQTELLMLSKKQRLLTVQLSLDGSISKVLVLTNLDLSPVEPLVDKISGENSAAILSQRAITFKDQMISVQTKQTYNLLQAIGQKNSSAISCTRIPNSDQIFLLEDETEEDMQDKNWMLFRDDSSEQATSNKQSLYIMNDPSSRSDNPLGYGTFGLPSVQRQINIGPGVFLAKTKSNWFMVKDRKIEHIDKQFLDEKNPSQDDEGKEVEKDDQGSLLPNGMTLSEILNLREWTDIESRETIHGITKVCLHFKKRKKINISHMYEQIKCTDEDKNNESEQEDGQQIQLKSEDENEQYYEGEDIDEKEDSSEDVKQVLDKTDTIKIVNNKTSLAIILDFSSAGHLLRVKRIQHPSPLIDAETYQELIDELRLKVEHGDDYSFFGGRNVWKEKLTNQTLKDYLQTKQIIVQPGEQIDKKKFLDKTLKLEKSVIQENVQVSFTGDYYLVRVIYLNQKKSYPKLVQPRDTRLENDKTIEQRHLEFYGKQPYEFRFAGKMLILIQKQEKEVLVFDTEMKECKKGQFDRFFSIQEKKETSDSYAHKSDSISIRLPNICSPYSIARASQNCKLEETIMHQRSNKCIIANENEVKIINVSNPFKSSMKNESVEKSYDFELVTSYPISKLTDLNDPENFVERACPVYHFFDVFEQKEKHIQEIKLQSNPQGDQLRLYANLPKQEMKQIGVFNTYSRLDVLTIDRILTASKEDCLTGTLELSVAWARFGQDTIFSKIAKQKDLEKLLKFMKEENDKLVEEKEEDRQSANLSRLVSQLTSNIYKVRTESKVKQQEALQKLETAYKQDVEKVNIKHSTTLKTHSKRQKAQQQRWKKTNQLEQLEEGHKKRQEKVREKRKKQEKHDPIQMQSIIKKKFNEQSQRDILTQIGSLSEEFNIFQVYTNQDDWRRMIEERSTISDGQIDRAFVKTQFTSQISELEWPRSEILFTHSSSTTQITIEEIQKALKDSSSKDEKFTKIGVTVKMIELGWFFQDQKGWFTFASSLDSISNQIVESLFIKVMLKQYWGKTQNQIFYWQVLPYLVLTALSIFHFKNMLWERIDERQPPGQMPNFILCTQILPYWLYNAYNEVLQLNKKGKKYINFWNLIDLYTLLSIAVVIICSFQRFEFISIDQVRVVAAITSCTMMIKLFDWLRLFEETAKYISLLEETIKDTFSFLVLIIVALSMFGVPMVILNQNRDEESQIYEHPINYWAFDMLINQYLLALGEFNMDAFSEGPQSTLCFIFFILATLITQITMLNMLIAIMGDTFDRHMENRNVNAIKAKLSLMSDLDGVIDAHETFTLDEVIQRIDREESQGKYLLDRQYEYSGLLDFRKFEQPGLLEEFVEIAAALIGRRRKYAVQHTLKYLFVVQPNVIEESETDEYWMGSIKRLTQIMSENNKDLNQYITDKVDQVKKNNKEQNQNIIDQVKDLDQKIENQDAKLETMGKQLTELVSLLKKDDIQLNEDEPDQEPKKETTIEPKEEHKILPDQNASIKVDATINDSINKKE